MDVTTILNLIVSVFTSFSQMAGVAALVVALVNVLKTFGVVTDGNAGQWFAGLDLGAIVLLILAQIFYPQIGVAVLDSNAGLAGMVIMLILGYVGQMGFGKVVHALFSSLKLPVIGKSFTK